MADFKDKRVKALGTTLTKVKKGTEEQDLVIAHLNSIGAIKMETSEEEITTLDSEGKEYIAGTIEAGELPIAGIIKGTDSEEQVETFNALLENASVENWIVEFPSGAKWEFEAFVKSFGTTEATTDGFIGFEGALKINGKPTFTKSV